MGDNTELLAFNIKMLKYLNIWSSKDTHIFVKKIKDYSLLLPIIPAYSAVVRDFYAQVTGMFEDIAGITENLIATFAIVCAIYITTCFSNNREKIRDLISEMHEFKKLSDETEVIETEKRVSFFSKMFITYGVLGTLFYTLVPMFQIEGCEENRLKSKHSQHIPCGLVTRSIIPEKWKDFPYFYMLYLDQIYTCIIVSLLTLSITVLLCGLLMHTVTQIKFLKTKLLNSCKEENSDELIEKEVNFCVKYHQRIIEYAVNLENAFKTMMMMHLTITSLSISVLGFEIIMVSSISDSIRFGLHLGGWIILLLLTCYYGQILINESTSIGHVAYSAGWYIAKPSVRRDLSLIILRSQTPLTLSANSLGIMSLEVFLKVMSSAYSYFTLLLKVKN